jgi:hypothetical protein
LHDRHEHTGSGSVLAEAVRVLGPRGTVERLSFDPGTDVLDVWVVLNDDTEEQRRNLENDFVMMKTRQALNRLVVATHWPEA